MHSETPVEVAPAPSGTRPGHPRTGGRWAGSTPKLLIAPAMLWWALFLAIPLALVLAMTFLTRGTYGGVDATFTLDNYGRVLDPLFFRVLWFSLRIAAVTTVLCLLIGYPVAYFIATAPRRLRPLLLILAILPFWTSLLIRMYAWIVLLSPTGIINRGLQAAGAIDDPLPLLYNDFAITLGLVYGYLPLMILPIYAALERIGSELAEASSDLGARALSTLRYVHLPLAKSGVIAGCLFVFIPSLGNFTVPELLGGGSRVMIGSLVESQFLSARDWPFGGTLAVILMLFLTILLLVQSRSMRQPRGGE